ncbi:Uncharacterised protein [uncultured archaeon]|nr:Uncharacterised protein [uncultured archaeon]
MWFFVSLIPIALALVAPAADLHNPNGVLIQILPSFESYLPLSIGIGALIILLGVVILPGDHNASLIRRILNSFLVFLFFLLFEVGALAFSGKIMANSTFPYLFANALELNTVFVSFFSGLFLFSAVADYYTKFAL